MHASTIFRSRAFALGALGVLAVACASLIPPQNWDRQHGPVVPHDSFPADCSLCHTGTSWNEIRPDFSFDHEGVTGVPLRGAHARASCLRCHNDRGPVARFAVRGCAGCHTDVHRGDLGPDCASCHDEQTWHPREMIARHNRTRFPLVGAHAVAACWRCHPGAQVGNFAGADPTCLACHGDDLARATSPDHAANGWTTDCQRCHVPIAWQPARFAHPSSFPLTGGHAGRACSACHTGGTFAGLSPDCASCHLDDYQGTSDPNHTAAGFSTDCAQCHSTNGWAGARFTHPFPITSGPHRLACVECHQTPGNFASFSCTHCHAHSAAEMADKHNDVNGYVWVSASCYACHPTGRER